jgi:hypothetical protein
MKKKHIVLLSIISITLLSHLYLFTGSKEFKANCVDRYDGYSNALELPITKYEKGFLNYTFYVCTSIKDKPYEIRFKMDYINKTVVFEDYKKLNERIKMIEKEYARPVARHYSYLDINGESYFDNIVEDGINVRLIETIENKQDRQIIINLSDQTIKIRL